MNMLLQWAGGPFWHRPAGMPPPFNQSVMFLPVRTGLATDPLFSRHLTGPGHPERPERLPAILNRIKGLELTAVAARDAAAAELEAVHAPRYVAWAREQIESGVQLKLGVRIKSDFVVLGIQVESLTVIVTVDLKKKKS